MATIVSMCAYICSCCENYEEDERPYDELPVLDYEEQEFETPETVDFSNNDNWEVPNSSLQCTGIREIGHGQFGEVWHEGLLGNITPVAIKTLKPGTMYDKYILAEAEIMKKLRHPNIIQLYAVSTQDVLFCIVTELITPGSLLEYLRGRGRTLDLLQRIDLAVQIASGMCYLECLNVVHRDLAARNVFFGKRNKIKIANFGFSRVLEDDQIEFVAEDGEKYPVRWTAPEGYKFNTFSTKSDVWSFGILLTEIVTHGEKPYPGMTHAEVQHQVEEGYRMPAPPSCPRTLYLIIKECWQRQDFERPSFQNLKRQLDVLSTIDWNEYCYFT